ncbi:MAG TPA: dihydrolipoamide acetyltransferase family protein [Saprospiraceae bacterium]|nr:dihydrolipoamide acetyltransferase family protein [Saprospiraceae bacterium]HND89004.1 dihydrolipoamide acetyltransferase family protein [Saprospiraceae bacterium]
MARVELVMPKMGESIMEATILKWRKKPGDRVELDEPVLDIATDKVDSEVPSPVAGTLVDILFQENDVVAINKTIAIIETEASAVQPQASPALSATSAAAEPPFVPAAAAPAAAAAGAEGRFYSPLVRTIAKEEGISQTELERIPGTGQDGRVNKKDILAYVAQRGKQNFEGPYPQPQPVEKTPVPPPAAAPAAPAAAAPAVSISGNVEIVEMDRMRKLIADHMVMSKQTSAHVTSFVEVDVTDLVNWRNRVKDQFKKQYGENITFTPIFVEAVARAIRDFPMINSSVDGQRIVVRKDVNIGMAAALPSGNLIVPVIKGADMLNLVGLTKTVNDLANRARQNKLKPDETQGGTFTLTNVGTFGNVMGTPIINQPQVAIMATGAIRKKPAVLETEYGDVIAVRQMMFLSLSYDHRIVDGMLGGSFLRRVADYLEQFDPNRAI